MKGSTRKTCECCGRTYYEPRNWDSFGMCRDCTEWSLEESSR